MSSKWVRLLLIWATFPLKKRGGGLKKAKKISWVSSAPEFCVSHPGGGPPVQNQSATFKKPNTHPGMCRAKHWYGWEHNYMVITNEAPKRSIFSLSAAVNIRKATVDRPESHSCVTLVEVVNAHPCRCSRHGSHPFIHLCRKKMRDSFMHSTN